MIFKNCNAMQSLTQIFQTVEGLSKIMLKERQCGFERTVLMERANIARFSREEKRKTSSLKRELLH